MRDIVLRSGKWRWTGAEPDRPARSRIELIDPAAPENKLLVPVSALEPSDDPSLAAESVAEAARDPDVRLWTDEYGIAWRIARVGPGTHHPYPFRTRHLVFDSPNAYAGIVEIDRFARLGDLQDDELRAYRDRMKDFGGRRRAFRPPTPTH